jgi:hypothetical protein
MTGDPALLAQAGPDVHLLDGAADARREDEAAAGRLAARAVAVGDGGGGREQKRRQGEEETHGRAAYLVAGIARRRSTDEDPDRTGSGSWDSTDKYLRRTLDEPEGDVITADAAVHVVALTARPPTDAEPGRS